MSDSTVIEKADVEALKELFGDDAAFDLEATAQEVGSYENAEDPQAIGGAYWAYRSYRYRC